MSSIMAGRSVPPAEHIGRGLVVAVVGPSGAGKDSVMACARARLTALPRPVCFIRRVITRPADGTEDHESVDAGTFRRMAAAGAFAVHWSAHGLHYGLPSSMDGIVAKGGIAVANVSRGVIPEMRQRYALVLPVVVTASVPVLAERLQRRGRESADAVAARIRRAEAQELAIEGAETIVNDGPLEAAAERFVAVLHRACETIQEPTA